MLTPSLTLVYTSFQFFQEIVTNIRLLDFGNLRLHPFLIHHNDLRRQSAWALDLLRTCSSKYRQERVEGKTDGFINQLSLSEGSVLEEFAPIRLQKWSSKLSFYLSWLELVCWSDSRIFCHILLCLARLWEILRNLFPNLRYFSEDRTKNRFRSLLCT